MLAFPTIAEQVVAEWRGLTKTLSLTIVAERRGGERQPGLPITYTFDDDTSLVIEGRGRAHNVRTEYP